MTLDGDSIPGTELKPMTADRFDLTAIRREMRTPAAMIVAAQDGTGVAAAHGRIATGATLVKVFHICLIVAILLVGPGGVSGVYAQPAAPRVEIGAQISTLRLTDSDATNAGLGGRVSYDLAPWLAAEGEFSFFPTDEIAVLGSALSGSDFRVVHRRQRAEAFFGLKLGTRFERFGVFAKVRPGFASLTHREMECVGAPCALMMLLLVQPVYRTELAVDLGGVLEFYPSSRMVVRVDLGDTIIRHRSTAPPCWIGECTTHNFASRFGIGFRF